DLAVVGVGAAWRARVLRRRPAARGRGDGDGECADSQAKKYDASPHLSLSSSWIPLGWALLYLYGETSYFLTLRLRPLPPRRWWSPRNRRGDHRPTTSVSARRSLCARR